MLLTAAALWTGCDSVVTEQSETHAIARDAEVYTYSDGSTVEVVLENTHRPERMRFASLDEFHTHLEKLDASGRIRVNVQHWAGLKHGNDPAEVSVLDADRSVEIGDFLYTLERDGVYRQSIGAPAESRVLEFYYGASGKEDLAEFTLASRAFDGTDVSGVEFKNAFARGLVQSAKEYLAKGHSAPSADYAAGKSMVIGDATCDAPVQDSNSIDYRYCYGLYTTLFPDGTATWLPSDYDTSAGYYDVRVKMLNQSYTDGFKKKAYGVTGSSIRKNGSGDPYFGLTSTSCPTYSDVVRSGTIEYQESGYYFNVGVKVESDVWEYAACEWSDKADRSGGAQSYHDADMRERWYDSSVTGGITGVTRMLVDDEYLQ